MINSHSILKEKTTMAAFHSGCQEQTPLAQLAEILATAYLRLLATSGHNWRNHKQLREQRKSEEPAENGGLNLDLSEN